FTYVANNQPRQGQSFRTGSNTNGYQLNAVSVQMAGYSANNATAPNGSAWNLNPAEGPIMVALKELSGEETKYVSVPLFKAGAPGNPGNGASVNGAGMWISFEMPFTTILKPDTVYCFELVVGNGSDNYFEWLGSNEDLYTGGTAYNPSGSGIAELAGDRVFALDIDVLQAPADSFAHPSSLHTRADIELMKAKIAAQEEPWKSGWEMFQTSPYLNLGWPAYDVDYIIRGATGNNYTRSQQDAQLIYNQALMWQLTGDTAYADRAVYIANVWSDLLGIQGDTNASLAAGICGYLFAIGGELLSSYEGWPQAEKQAYKDMMMRVFYPANHDFLWRHHDTPFTRGGNTHYRLNWDSANMLSMAAIGVLCDNRAVYEQAIDFFKHGPGNGRVERAAWYIHPDGTAQSEETGRDQGHAVLSMYQMALICQIAWNQGEDLFSYDNNRLLRSFEYITKHNLYYAVPWVYHRNTDLAYTETLAYDWGRLHFFHELVYNHYTNIKGMAAPYNEEAAAKVRPERWPNVAIHPSEVDWFGMGTLTFSKEPIGCGIAPSGIVINRTKNRITLNWQGTARATGYNIKRAESSGGPYALIAAAGNKDLYYTDDDIASGQSYYYVISADTDAGETADSPEAASEQRLVCRYDFDGDASDSISGKDGELLGGAAGAPAFVSGKSGQAISFSGEGQYVQLPKGIANYQDITIAFWAKWNGGNAWQRFFDFGSEIEKTIFITPSNGSAMQFRITTSRGADGTGNVYGAAMSIGAWRHIAVSLNGDTATMYVDGRPVGSAVVDMVDPLFSQIYCYLGRSMWNGDAFYNGLLDDFRIYNYALSGSEIWQLGAESANLPPEFEKDWFDLAGAVEGIHYRQDIAGCIQKAGSSSLTFEKVTGPSWLNVSDGGVITGLPKNDSVGEWIVVVRVRDEQGATDDASFKISVQNTNGAPVWNEARQITAQLACGENYSHNLTDDVSDSDSGDELSFALISGPDWLSVSSDGNLSGTASEENIGVSEAVVQAVDLSGAFADKTIKLLVRDARAIYRFEGNAFDLFNDENASTNGEPNFTIGLLDGCIEMDGVDDYVDLPDGIAFSEDITVTAWIKWNGGGSWQRVFDFGNDTDNNIFLTPYSGTGTMRFAIKTAGTEQFMDCPAPATGEWTHIAVKLRGSNGAGRIFVNGEEAASASFTKKPNDIYTTANYIGKSQWPDPLFSGAIDDARIYNRSLNIGEIQAVMAGSNAVEHAPQFINSLNRVVGTGAGVPLTGRSIAGLAFDPDGDALNYAKVNGPDWLTVSEDGTLSGTPSETDAGLNVFTISAADATGTSAAELEIYSALDPLAAYYRFDEGLEDSTGLYHAYSSGAPAFTGGVREAAIVFDGFDDRVILPEAIADAEDIMITAWVFWNGGGNWQRIFDFGTDTSHYMFLTPNGGGNMRFAINNGAGEQVVYAPTLETGRWVHVAVKLRGSNGAAKIYIDGTEAGSNTFTISARDLNATNNLIAGSQFAADPLFSGMIDELRVYHHSLGLAEIEALASAATGLSQLENQAKWWLSDTAYYIPESACLEADYTGDGIVDLADCAALAAKWSASI
ncbi:MAG: LamG-like jellyroll fold domain-containing protein, partial [Phycisphaerae bacterium]